jgi:hypothetical protein
MRLLHAVAQESKHKEWYCSSDASGSKVIEPAVRAASIVMAVYPR